SAERATASHCARRDVAESLGIATPSSGRLARRGAAARALVRPSRLVADRRARAVHGAPAAQSVPARSLPRGRQARAAVRDAGAVARALRPGRAVADEGAEPQEALPQAA